MGVQAEGTAWDTGSQWESGCRMTQGYGIPACDHERLFPSTGLSIPVYIMRGLEWTEYVPFWLGQSVFSWVSVVCSVSPH